MRHNQVAVARPVEALQVPDGGGAVTVPAERREVVQSQQVSRRDAHSLHIQDTRPGGDVTRLQRLHAVGRRRQPVRVVTPQRRESGVETRRRAGDGEDPDIAGQEPAEAPEQRLEFRLPGAR